MTQDYRKRAEEFVEHYSCEDTWYSCPEAGGCNDSITECDCGYESKLEKLSAAFQQVAQEARREENEACQKLCFKLGPTEALAATLKAIGSRMEVKNG